MAGHSAGAPANTSRVCRVTQAWYRHSPRVRHLGNSEDIASAQFSTVVSGPIFRRTAPPAGGQLGQRSLQWYVPAVDFRGEWRNGRRAGFRCQCPSGRGGSSPPSPTMSGSTNRRHQGHELIWVRGLDVFLDVFWGVCWNPLRNRCPDLVVASCSPMTGSI